MKLGKYGHQPDQGLDADVEVDRLRGALVEAQAGLSRASEYRAVTPNAMSIRKTVLWALDSTKRALEKASFVDQQ